MPILSMVLFTKLLTLSTNVISKLMILSMVLFTKLLTDFIKEETKFSDFKYGSFY